MELYTTPRIMVITFKRFKRGKSRFSMFGGDEQGDFDDCEKMDTQVDFPLEGLDMSKYVMSESQKTQESLIYDCFAVSNHYGGTGGGHYTAYCKHPHNERWYEYDDSCVQNLGDNKQDIERTVVGSQAYSIFYRRRDKVDLARIDFNMISKQPNTGFLEKIEERRKAKKATNEEEVKK